MSYWTDKLLDEPTVVWAPPTQDGLGGLTWGSPTETLGRWQYTVNPGGAAGPDIRYTPDGTTSPARTVVWLKVEPELDSYLFKGELTDLPPSYEVVEIASQVIAVKNVRSIPTQNYLYMVYLDER